MTHGYEDQLAGIKGLLNIPPLDNALINSIRKMAYVPRCAGIRKIRTQYLSEHCFGVATLFMLLAKEEKIPYTVDELQFVLLHDIMETETGDLLYPAKHTLDNNDHMDHIEENIAKVLPHLAPYTDNVALSDEVRALWRDCDMLDFFFWVVEEAEMGNSTLTSEFYVATAKLSLSHFTSVQSLGGWLAVRWQNTRNEH